jgi:competence protein ComEC
MTGVLLVQRLSQLPDPWWSALLLPLVVAGLRSRWAWVACWLLAGAAWATLFARLLLATGLPAELEGRDLWLDGVIASIPQGEVGRLRFNMDVARLFDGESEYAGPGRVRLSAYHSQRDFQVGDRWRLRVRLKRPHGFQNPGGFDYEGWLFHQHIRASGYLREHPGNRRLDSDPWSHPLDRLRARIVQRIQHRLGDHPQAGVLTALVTGVRDRIDPEQWRTLMYSGTNHLVAISGLHVGLVAGLVFFLCRWGWSRLGRAPLWCPAPKAAALGALLAASAYAALAGFAIPTQRALVMLAVVMLGVWRQRPVSPWRTLASALILVLLLDPLAVIDAGFWLSFTAVAVILIGVLGRRPDRRRWRQWWRVQWVIGLGLIPASLGFFQRLPLAAPLANLLAVPVVGFLVVPLALGGLLLELLFPHWPLAGWCWQAAAGVLQGLWPALHWIAQQPALQWFQFNPPLWLAAGAMLGIVLLLAPRGTPARWTGLVWLLPLFIWQPPQPTPGSLRVTLLDVGQGLAVVVRTRRHTMVYDTGARYSETFDMGRAVVVPFLRHQGVRQLDTLVLSHGDNDHVGGAASLMEDMPVKSLLASEPGRFAGARACRAGQRWRWDGVEFEILHPDPRVDWQGNDRSCVLMIRSPYGNALLPGDIEALAELSLARRLGDGLGSRLLLVPHHGSKTSSTSRFLRQVNPELALVASGYRSRYGHPHPEVVARYASLGIRLYDSPSHGAVTVEFGPRGLVSSSYRHQARRYWFAP